MLRFLRQRWRHSLDFVAFSQSKASILNRGGEPPTDDAARELDDRLRILLPLTLERGQGSIADPIGELKGRFPASLDRDLAKKLLSASGRGETAVSKAIGELLDEALKPGVPP